MTALPRPLGSVGGTWTRGAHRRSSRGAGTRGCRNCRLEVQGSHLASLERNVNRCQIVLARSSEAGSPFAARFSRGVSEQGVSRVVDICRGERPCHSPSLRVAHVPGSAHAISDTTCISLMAADGAVDCKLIMCISIRLSGSYVSDFSRA